MLCKARQRQFDTSSHYLDYHALRGILDPSESILIYFTKQNIVDLANMQKSM
jgi:hypothetical protein